MDRIYKMKKEFHAKNRPQIRIRKGFRVRGSGKITTDKHG